MSIRRRNVVSTTTLALLISMGIMHAEPSARQQLLHFFKQPTGAMTIAEYRNLVKQIDNQDPDMQTVNAKIKSLIDQAGPHIATKMLTKIGESFQIIDLGGELDGPILSATAPNLRSGVQGTTPAAYVASGANIYDAIVSATRATDANTANCIVKRDSSGNFSANVITANTINGTLSGEITGTAGGTITFGSYNRSQIATANTASTIVARDGSGNFAAGTITAALTGNVTGNLTGNITGSSGAAVYFGGYHRTAIATANTASAIVARDGSGNFAAGTITAALTGNVTGNLTGNITGSSGAAVYFGGYHRTAIATANTASAIVARDGSGNFSAGTITAQLTGTANGAVTFGSYNRSQIATANTASTIVARDGSGNFAAGTITGNLTGNITGSSGAAVYFGGYHRTAIATANTASAIVARDGSGNFSAGTITGNLTGNITGSSGAAVYFGGYHRTAIATANTASAIVARDGSGNFAAGTITAALTGNVTGNTTGIHTGNVTGAHTVNLSDNFGELILTGTGAAMFLGGTSAANAVIHARTGSNASSDNTNIYVGVGAGSTNMFSSSQTGTGNAALGNNALQAVTTGYANAAIGLSALKASTTGGENVALGALALTANTTGTYNVAIGARSLQTVKQSAQNTAVGFNTMSKHVSGIQNMAFGFNAGSQLVKGSNNIYIGNLGAGQESTVIRLGTTTTHTGCFIAGVDTANVGSGANAVFINSSGQLGTVVSSGIYKHDIRALTDGQVDNVFRNLNPVSFKYNNDPEDSTHFGLIAEEVAELVKDNPVLENLVLKRNGVPHTVSYHLLPTLLLKQTQKQQVLLDAYAQKFDSYEKELKILREEITRDKARATTTA